jgi:hypothetical protein
LMGWAGGIYGVECSQKIIQNVIKKNCPLLMGILHTRMLLLHI